MVSVLSHEFLTPLILLHSHTIPSIISFASSLLIDLLLTCI